MKISSANKLAHYSIVGQMFDAYWSFLILHQAKQIIISTFSLPPAKLWLNSVGEHEEKTLSLFLQNTSAKTCHICAFSATSLGLIWGRVQQIRSFSWFTLKCIMPKTWIVFIFNCTIYHYPPKDIAYHIILYYYKKINLNMLYCSLKGKKSVAKQNNKAVIVKLVANRLEHIVRQDILVVLLLMFIAFKQLLLLLKVTFCCLLTCYFQFIITGYDTHIAKDSVN